MEAMLLGVGNENDSDEGLSTTTTVSLTGEGSIFFRYESINKFDALSLSRMYKFTCVKTRLRRSLLPVG